MIIKNTILTVLAGLSLPLPYKSTAQNPQADSAWIVTHYVKKEVYIPVRDGKKLFTAIYTPIDKETPHAILLNRTPYSIAPYGEGAFKAFWYTPYMAYFKDNYIVVLQDVRGRY